MPKYTTDGYVEGGYIEGDSNLFSVPSIGNHPLKFFVSDGTKTEELLKAAVAEAVNVDDVVVLYVPENKKIMFGGKDGFIEFLGGVDINTIINSQEFIDAVQATTNVVVNMTASIVASDGSVVTNAVVTQTAPTTFNVTVPQELVGTSYSIVLDGGA